MENLYYWDQLRTPPKAALKPIEAGRLKGKTDINPAWRMQVMTATFGPCGIGWKYKIVETKEIPASTGEIAVITTVEVAVKVGEAWSEPIPGIGGSMLLAKERSGLYFNDEAHKMALTDALSVAMKALGVAADIYMGMANGSGSKYQQQAPTGQTQQPKVNLAPLKAAREASGWTVEQLVALSKEYFEVEPGALNDAQIKTLIDTMSKQPRGK